MRAVQERPRDPQAITLIARGLDRNTFPVIVPAPYAVDTLFDQLAKIKQSPRAALRLVHQGKEIKPSSSRILDPGETCRASNRVRAAASAREDWPRRFRGVRRSRPHLVPAQVS